MHDIPRELLARPFTSTMARDVGVSARQLQGSRCQRLFRDVYVGADITVTTELLASGISLLLPPGTVVGGTAAALLHGADVRRRRDPVEVVACRDSQIRRPGIRASAALLEPGDIVMIGGVPVTSPVRTAFDLARKRDVIEAVVGVDAMLNRGGCRLEELAAYIAGHRGWRGVRWADRATFFAEPKAESPMESRQRMRFVLAGLPRPKAQVELYTESGIFVARLDHGYLEWKVGPEYDGEPHEGRWRADNERQERIRAMGWWHRRYTSLSIGNGWIQMVDEVAAALLAAGWRP
ncbi:MAG TPA: type IV toxin-antitoxin system AbiEi family antitoxin [Mycobacteriales bacterium]|jgi:hypothetical protein|nr:type IV toxin-antitoxin system AbiEi family antitoxin [Mycobacteriales bacterium]